MRIDKEQTQIAIKHRLWDIASLLETGEATVVEARIAFYPLTKYETLEIEIKYEGKVPQLVVAE